MTQCGTLFLPLADLKGRDMSTTGGVLVVVLSLLAGFGGGYAYEAIVGSKQAATTSSSSTETASTQTLEECLTDVWGTDKYAAITANASLATTEDNFSALKCYQAK